MRHRTDDQSAAFANFVTTFRHRAVRYAILFTDASELAEDIVSDAFAKAWKMWSMRPEIEHLEGWFIVIVKHQALNTMRSERARRRRELQTGAEHLQRQFTSSEPSDRLLLLLEVWEELNDADSAILVLFYVEQRSLEQIAASLGVTPGAVSMRLSRLRRQLKETILQLESSSHD